jgi:hypothetical protein
MDNVGVTDIAPEGEPEESTGAVQRVVAELSDYLGLLFKPAAGQLGLIAFDQVQHWRLRNLMRLTEKLKRLKNRGRANPRVAWAVLEQAASTDDDGLLDMWAGLLDSSRSESNPSDANIMFVSRLAQLSANQAQILNHLCANGKKRETGAALLIGEEVVIKIKDDEFFGPRDRVALDLDLDHLRHLGLIEGGIMAHSPDELNISSSALGLHMYVRCVGSRLAPIDYFLTDPNVVRADTTSPPGPS